MMSDQQKRVKINVQEDLETTGSVIVGTIFLRIYIASAFDILPKSHGKTSTGSEIILYYPLDIWSRDLHRQMIQFEFNF